MSIENNLKRIADALEKLAEGTVAEAPVEVAVVEAPVAEVPAPPVAEVPAPPVEVEAPVAEVPAPPAPVMPPVPTSTEPVSDGAMTGVELNNLLVDNVKRIGSRDGVDAVMRDMGIGSVADLDANTQLELIERVQAL